MSNQASEKEAGPNISVKGYDVIEEIKTELEKECPNVVSCADIISVSARDSVKLSGGPEYAVLLGRRDSLVSNREDADNLPGPDIAVPKLIDEFDKQ
ncbi:Peroxidase 60 [Zea mays]|nr:Peroxidase 60 [Zea mays]